MRRKRKRRTARALGANECLGRLGLVGVEKTRNVDAAIPFIKIFNRIAFGPDILLLQASFEASSSQHGSPHRHDSLAVAASLGQYQGPVRVPREQQSGIDVWSGVGNIPE